VNPAQLITLLSGIAKALLHLNEDIASSWQHLIREKPASATEQNLAMQLSNASQPLLIIVALVNNHPQASVMRSLAALICELTGARLLILPQANSRAMQLAEAVPERITSQQEESINALNAKSIWEKQLRAYVLFNVEPEFDCADPAAACLALQRAGLVVA